jgi:thymidine phosphorylase
VGSAAGLPTRALITDQDAVLGHSAGNALEVREALDFLTGRERRSSGATPDTEPVQRAVTLALGAELLVLGGLSPDVATATARLQHSLSSGAAAEHFARMVRALGGPADVLADAQLPVAPVQRAVPAPRAGVVAAMDTRALGLAVVALGGGRLKPGDAVDPRVGLAEVRPRGAAVSAGEPLAVVHAAHAVAAEEAVRAVLAAFTVADAAPPRPAAVRARVQAP